MSDGRVEESVLAGLVPESVCVDRVDKRLGHLNPLSAPSMDILPKGHGSLASAVPMFIYPSLLGIFSLLIDCTVGQVVEGDG